ncbi:helix-turn-helix domain-containing protein [Streptomyces sp. NPDC002814]|uniref:helix-turn-helix domain-containing protein n=1 Tax=Streptomyces sp. GESEQ-4 TaxID=2812655 RepID=UPI001B331AE1|nr:helix-turn-helix transcriptional regulator [Streptomyces sp. GESEQ-4]
MGGWQPLPDDLPPEVRHFVEQLRQVKDRTGLSLVALGARTAYSKSSWHRYLNATQPPPRQAVVALCRVAGVDAERLGVRWEMAVEAWPRPTGTQKGDGGEEYEDDPTRPWWDTPDEVPAADPSRRLLVVAAVLVLVLLVLTVIGVVVFG